jgi:hypothetical protein
MAGEVWSVNYVVDILECKDKIRIGKAGFECTCWVMGDRWYVAERCPGKYCVPWDEIGGLLVIGPSW